MDHRVIIIAAAEALLAYIFLIRLGELESIPRLAVSALLLAAAFVLRLSVFDYETADYTDFLTRWVDHFRYNGGFKALAGSVGNYNLPYLYFLAFFSYSSIKDLYLIKLLSIFFDTVLAAAVCGIVRHFRKDGLYSLAAFFAVLFLPTVFLNGALWGQCDSIYVAMGVLAFYLMLEDRPAAAMLSLALSFGFKLQAVFLIPVFAVFLFNGKLKLRHILVFPLVYIGLTLPAVIAGKPFVEALTMYLDQIGTTGTGLNYNSPSLFAFLDRRQVPDAGILSSAGIAAAFVFMAVLLLIAVFMKKRLTDRALLLLEAALALGIPLLLPGMHDRYFFAADILTLTCAFVFLPAVFCAAATQFASLLGYYAYLRMRYFLVMKWGAIPNIASELVLLLLFAFSLRTGRSDDTAVPSCADPCEGSG